MSLTGDWWAARCQHICRGSRLRILMESTSHILPTASAPVRILKQHAKHATDINDVGKKTLNKLAQTQVCSPFVTLREKHYTKLY